MIKYLLLKHVFMHAKLLDTTSSFLNLYFIRFFVQGPDFFFKVITYTSHIFQNHHYY